MADRSELTRLVRKLSHSMQHVRSAAVRELGELGDKTAVSALVEAQSDPSDQRLLAAVEQAIRD